MRTSVEEYQAQFKFGLLEVVYEWARGKVHRVNMINLILELLPLYCIMHTVCSLLSLKYISIS